MSEGRDFSECNTLEDLSSSSHISCITVEDLYLFMGRELDTLHEIPAGNVLGKLLRILDLGNMCPGQGSHESRSKSKG